MLKETKLKVIVIWIATILLSAMFLFGSSIKMFGWIEPIFEQQMEMMVRYGFNREFYFLIGVIECFGAIAILWNRRHWIAALGALAILTTSTGALICHVIFDRGEFIVPSIVTFTLSSIVFLHNWPSLKAAFAARASG